MTLRYRSLIVSLLLVASPVLAGPMIKMAERRFDFGRTSQNATISHRFWIENVGDDTLVITRVVPGCGCTRAPLLDSVLAPGRKTALDIYFSTKGYLGQVKKVPYFETNIGDEKIMLTIESELVPRPDTLRPVYVSPYKVDVSQYRPTPVRDKAKFYICNPDTIDYHLTLEDHAAQVFDVEMPELVKANDSARVAITVHPDYLDKEFEESLTFSIDSPVKIRYTVPIKRMLRIKERE